MLTVMLGGVVLDTDATTEIGFKYTSGWVDGIQANGKYRTFEFSVPATAKNNYTFMFSNNTSYAGMRNGVPGSISAGGLQLDGTIFLVSCDKYVYNLLFVHGIMGKLSNSSGDFPDSIVVTAKMSMTVGGTIPNFGFYSYQNGNGTYTELSVPLDHMPVVNMGYWLEGLATMAGYTVTWPANTGWLTPWSYGLTLAQANTYSKISVVASGSGHAGWTVSVSGNHTLADAGLQLQTTRYIRGTFNENVTVHIFQALRPVKIQYTGSGDIYFAGQFGYRIYNASTIGETADISEFTLNIGEWFTLVNRYYDLNPANTKWNGGLQPHPGYETPVNVMFTVLDDDGLIGNGETLYLSENLPDMTLEEGLQAFCDIICGTYTLDTSAMTITVETLAGKLANLNVEIDLNKERIVKVGNVMPYIDGWAQHNYVLCDSDEYVKEETRFRRDYMSLNDYLDKENELSVIPFNEGNPFIYDDNGTNRLCAYIEDVVENDNGYDYTGNMSIICEAPAGCPALHLNNTTRDGLGLDYGEFTSNAVTLEITVALPLFRFMTIHKGTLVHYMSKNWVVRSADWKANECRMTLLSYDVAPELPDQNYLRFTMPKGGDVTLTRMGNPTPVTLEYSLDDGVTWTEWQEVNSVRAVTLAAAQTVMIRNTSNTSTGLSTVFLNDYYQFAFTDDAEGYGNVNSLLCKYPGNAVLTDYCYCMLFGNCSTLTKAPELPSDTVARYSYSYMFFRCDGLVAAPDLPATSLAEYCYESMFGSCDNLATAPDLPATSLAEYCYSSMFNDCQSLVTPPVLPAVNMAPHCYETMFYNCKSLVTAPKLPAQTLVDSCYLGMFGGGSLLNHVTLMATDISASNCLLNWLQGVAASGDLYAPASLVLPAGASGLPSGWAQHVIY